MKNIISKIQITLIAILMACLAGLCLTASIPAKAEQTLFSKFEMETMASTYIPYEQEGFGLRFAAKVDDADATYGMIIAPYDYFVSAGVTFEGEEDYAAKLDTLNKPTNYLQQEGLVVKSDGRVTFSISGILPNNLDRYFMGVAYKLVDGEKVYADVNASYKNCISFVASEFINQFPVDDDIEGNKADLQAIVQDAVELNNGGEEFTLTAACDNVVYKGTSAEIEINLPESINGKVDVVYSTDKEDVILAEDGKITGVGNGTGVTLTVDIAGVYTATVAALRSGIQIAAPAQSPQATYHSFEKAEMTDVDTADVRENVWQYTKTNATSTCFDNRMFIKVPNGQSVRGKWLLIEAYFTEYSKSEFAMEGMYGGNNYGSFSGFNAYSDFSAEYLRLFDAQGKVITDLSSDNIVGKWMTVATKIDKTYSDDGVSFTSHSFSFFNSATGSCYIDGAKFVDEQFMIDNFEHKVIVEHYKQQEDGSYALETEMIDATLGETVIATAKVYSGYQVNSAASTLSATKGIGATILKIYYDIVAESIPWEAASILTITSRELTSGTITWTGSHTYETAIMEGEDAKDNVYKYTLDASKNLTPYQVSINYKSTAISDLTGYWIVLEMYIDTYAADTFSAPILHRGNWSGYTVPVKVFDADGVEITDLSSENLKGRWITVAVNDTHTQATTTTSIRIAGGKGLSEIYISKVACLSAEQYTQFFGD